jgi:hypothetical protein
MRIRNSTSRVHSVVDRGVVIKWDIVYIVALILVLLVSVATTFMIYNIQLYERVFTSSHNDYKHIQQLKARLIPVFNELEYIPVFPNTNTTYTINKHTIYLCIKDEHGTYYDDHMLTYALLHELAHVLNTHNVGHTKEWSDIFESLLVNAQRHDLIDRTRELPPKYCDHVNTP